MLDLVFSDSSKETQPIVFNEPSKFLNGVVREVTSATLTHYKKYLVYYCFTDGLRLRTLYATATCISEVVEALVDGPVARHAIKIIRIERLS